MSTITRERLLKIKHWRETYGPGSNVVLPAEEAEELARIALASLEAEKKPETPELSQVIYHFQDWNEGFPVKRFKADYVISWMLANYPPAPVVPNGWMMVPIEPTEHMIVEGFESEPDEDFGNPEVWESYQAMSGCQQAAHRAKLCWTAMINAAPKMENV